MRHQRLLILAAGLCGVAVLAGCNYFRGSQTSAAAQPAGTSAANGTATGIAAANSTAVGSSAANQSVDPPVLALDLSVEQAYAAIPHRRTVWAAVDSTAPAEEQVYLNAIFQTVDQGIALRVAAEENYREGSFDAVDIDAQYERLVNFARGMSVPAGLASHHQDALNALTNDRQFFRNWNRDRANFAFAQRVADAPEVRAASSAAHAAYSELMSRYPNDSAANKDAFYDYYCALDFL